MAASQELPAFLQVHSVSETFADGIESMIRHFDNVEFVNYHHGVRHGFERSVPVGSPPRPRQHRRQLR